MAPILKYGSCVWCHLYSIHKDRIASVRKEAYHFCLARPYRSDVFLMTSLYGRTMLGVGLINNLIQWVTLHCSL